MNRTVSDQSATSGDGAGRGNGGLLLWGPAGGRRGVPRGSGAQFTTTSCVRHCAEGEWGAERAGGRGTVEVGVSKRIGWVFSTGPMPYRSTAIGGPWPGLTPRPESRQMLPTLLSSILLAPGSTLSLRQPSWGALRDKPKGDTASSLPTSHPRKARTYRPLPASGCAPTVLLDSDSAAGQSGASLAPMPLAPWGCLDQSCRRLTAGGSSSRTRMTWRSSVPRSPGGGAGQG